MDWNDRVPAIIATFRLNRLLEKLGIKSTFGLKDSKDYVEKFLSRETGSATAGTYSVGVIEDEADPVETIGIIKL